MSGIYDRERRFQISATPSLGRVQIFLTDFSDEPPGGDHLKRRSSSAYLSPAQAREFARSLVKEARAADAQSNAAREDAVHGWADQWKGNAFLRRHVIPKRRGTRMSIDQTKPVRVRS